MNYVHPLNEHNKKLSNYAVENVMASFRSDRREAFVISKGYGMGDPLAPSKSEENSGGGRLVPPGGRGITRQ